MRGRVNGGKPIGLGVSFLVAFFEFCLLALEKRFAAPFKLGLGLGPPL